MGQSPYFKVAQQAATRAGIDPNIFTRQINQESGFNPGAVSPAGAVGIAQIVPQYHPDVNPHDPVASLNWAANYIGGLVKKYGGYAPALSVYNSGRPDAYKDPNFAKGETYRYVQNILGGTTPSYSPPTVGGAPLEQPQVLSSPLQNPVVQSVVASNDKLLGVTPPPFPQPTQLQAGLTPQPIVSPAGATPKAPRISGSTLKFIEQFAQPYGLTITSTTGGKHAKNSYHYRGRAVDLGGDPTRMAHLAEAALTHPGDFVEMFYTGPGSPGYFIKNGQVYPNSQLDPSIASEHTNHVHLAA